MKRYYAQKLGMVGKAVARVHVRWYSLHYGRLSALPRLTMRTGSPTTRLGISSWLAGFGRHYLARLLRILSQWELVHVSGDHQCGFGSQPQLCQKVSIACQDRTQAELVPLSGEEKIYSIFRRGKNIMLPRRSALRRSYSSFKISTSEPVTEKVPGTRSQRLASFLNMRTNNRPYLHSAGHIGSNGRKH